MADFQPGDLIDVTYRGVVRQHQPEVDYVTLDLVPSGYVDLFISAATTIDVVTKRSPQVGDTLLVSDFSSLPGLRPGTVLRSSGSNEAWLRTTNGWHSSLDASSPAVVAGDSFIILAIPA